MAKASKRTDPTTSIRPKKARKRLEARLEKAEAAVAKRRRQLEEATAELMAIQAGLAALAVADKGDDDGHDSDDAEASEDGGGQDERDDDAAEDEESGGGDDTDDGHDSEDGDDERAAEGAEPA